MGVESGEILGLRRQVGGAGVEKETRLIFKFKPVGLGVPFLFGTKCPWGSPGR